MHFKNILVLAVSSSIAAAAESFTITSQSDADALPATVPGDLFIASDYQADLTLTGVNAIQGSVSYQGGTGLGTFTAPKLEAVDGGISMVGTYASVSLPVIQVIKGGLRLVSRSPGFDCAEFDELEANKVIRGQYMCASG